jgi:hypothetical protein
MSTTGFFVKHSMRDIGRNKCHFCLSFFSVFLVVWSSLVINTMIDKGPIIFMQLAEAENGQYDGILKHSRRNDYENKAFLDYT